MTLKFVIPPEKPGQSRVRKYGYYSQRTGLRAFTRQADLKNSINYQFITSREVDTPENKAKSYWQRERYQTVSSDVHVLELVDGEWYTRWFLANDTKLDHLPWQVQKVKVVNRYGSVVWYPASDLEYCQKLVESSASDGNPYYKSATLEWRNPTEADAREDYVQWRIRVALERKYNSIMGPTVLDLKGKDLTVRS